MSGFVHLHNHFDEGSPRDSVAKIKETIKYVKSLGQKACAITDHGSTLGFYAFDKACKSLNVKGIYGIELYEAFRSAKLKEIGIDDKYYHSVMIARNLEGLKFLYHISSYANKLENKYYKPRYDIEYLKEHKDEIKGNVIFMTACIQGRFPQLLSQNNDKEAKEYIDTMTDIFGKENVFIELQNHGLKNELYVLPKLIKFAKDNNYQVVATNDVHYTKKEDAIARDIMDAREKSQTLEEYRDSKYALPHELYFKSEEEMKILFGHIPEAISNSKKIADMCDYIDLEGDDWHFPNMDMPEGYTSDSFMEEMVWDKIDTKYPNWKEDQVLIDRTKTEIEIMKQMNASAYMLIDADFIVWAKEHDILVGPGRGSACGSSVANIMDITNVDPLRFNLLFERFMNPERVSMMDIDTDYEDSRRKEVIEYVVKKYGADKVAAIRTKGTQGARSSIRDTGAVFNLDSYTIDRVAKMIPQEPGMTIVKALDVNIELKNLYDDDSTVKLLIDNAKKIEGLVRNTGSHAAGIIISDAPLTEYGSIIEDEDSDIPIFNADMKAVEYLKLLKMDFLGLRTLSVLKDTMEMVKQDYGKEIDLDNIDYDDKKVYNYIATGETHGVFQLEQSGMQKFMTELQPENLEDIVAGVALYRPGPMDSIPAFIEGKENPDSVEYPEDAKHLLEPILGVTYGQMVYQEQVMQIVRDLAGYTFGRSDLVRRGMAKKKMEIMERERYVFTYGEVVCPECSGTGKQSNRDNCILCAGEGKVASKTPCPYCKDREEDYECSHCNGSKFIESKGKVTVKGCVRNGISIETANHIYDLMIEFAKYAFNKSHAVAYAIISYQTAFLKYYYPRQYMTAYLNSVINNQDKIKQYIGIVRKMGINLLRPNINICKSQFIQDDNGIYMGLTALKSVGACTEKAIAEREQNGEFKDLQDLLERVTLNKRELESLIKAGALDEFGHKRSQMIHSLQDLKNMTKNTKDDKAAGQVSIFDVDVFNNQVDKKTKTELEQLRKFKFPNIAEYPEIERYRMEKEVSGYYLSGHPLELDEYKHYTRMSNISTIDLFSEKDDNKRIKIVGIITFDEEYEGLKISKKGSRYAVFHLEDNYSTIKCLMFKDSCEKYGHLINNDNIVKIDGTLKVEEEIYEDNNGDVQVKTDVKIFVNDIKSINDITKTNKVFLNIDKGNTNLIQIVSTIARKYPGQDDLFIVTKNDKHLYKYDGHIGYNQDLYNEISKLVNDKNIVVR
ncbi:MAG: DNA polymerase III subunit alpha [Candidatus Woesearchaeota archaeon]